MAVHALMYPGPCQIAAFESPDGKLRLVIYEQVPTPRPIMQSPYTYQLRLVDRATNRPLPGADGVQDNDSTASDPSSFNVVWTTTDVTATCDSPKRDHHATYASGVQVWR